MTCTLKQVNHDARCALCRKEFSGTIQILKEPNNKTECTRKIRFSANKQGKYGLNLEKQGFSVVINSVSQNSSACHAGIRSGDIICTINGLPCLNTRCTLQILHGVYKSGSIVSMEIKRIETQSSHLPKCLSCLTPLCRRR